MRRMQHHRGHLFNWYDTRTLQPLPPLFVSSVDSGNLAASLWTLEQGCERLLHEAIVRPQLAEGFLDHLRILTDLKAFPRRLLSRLETKSHTEDWVRTCSVSPKSHSIVSPTAIANLRMPQT